MVTNSRGVPRRLTGVSLAAIAVVVFGGCELGSTTIPRTDPMLVVHAILDPSLTIQEIKVEESLTGRVVVDSTNEDRGVPVSGATVTLTDPGGLVMIATETPGTGVYRVNLDSYTTPAKSARIQRGKRYALAVSARGITVTGSTLVPSGASPVGIPRVPFNRDRQTINLPINDVSLARAYWIRIEAPVQPYQLFTLDQDVAIAGDVRNIFTEDLLRVFYPGFEQLLTVAAVDTNTYDYYRSGNDPFSGRGLINHLSGGLGVFGSVVIVERRVLDVTQDSTGDSLEGRYTLRRGVPGVPADATEMTLFIEARGTAGRPDRISGRHLRGPSGGQIRGAVYGTRTADSLDLRLLVKNSTDEVNQIFTGRVKGDSLVGRLGVYGTVGSVLFVRAGK